MIGGELRFGLEKNGGERVGVGTEQNMKRRERAKALKTIYIKNRFSLSKPNRTGSVYIGRFT